MCDGKCPSCTNALPFKGCAQLTQQEPRLNKESIEKIASMITEMHKRVNVKISEESRPQIAKAIANEYREARERGDYT